MSTLMRGYYDDDTVTRNDLSNMPVPAPLDKRHRPTAFHEFVDCVEEQLDKVGLEFVKEEHILSKEGQRYFGLATIGPKEGQLITTKEWSYLLGLRGSYDQSVDMGAAVGTRVMVCSNLCFSGDIYTAHTKQTLNIWKRLPALLYNAVSRIPELAHLEEERAGKLQHYEMKLKDGDALLVEIYRRKGLSSNQLSRAVAEWYEPTYPEFAENGYTAWRLEQAVTEAVKPPKGTGNMYNVMSRTQVTHDLLTGLVI